MAVAVLFAVTVAVAVAVAVDVAVAVAGAVVVAVVVPVHAMPVGESSSEQASRDSESGSFDSDSSSVHGGAHMPERPDGLALPEVLDGVQTQGGSICAACRTRPRCVPAADCALHTTSKLYQEARGWSCAVHPGASRPFGLSSRVGESSLRDEKEPHPFSPKQTSPSHTKG